MWVVPAASVIVKVVSVEPGSICPVTSALVFSKALMVLSILPPSVISTLEAVPEKASVTVIGWFALAVLPATSVTLAVTSVAPVAIALTSVADTVVVHAPFATSAS